MADIKVNRAPVLTLWASVCAERLGFDRDEALTLGRALAGMAAQAKGRAIGIYEAHHADDLRAEARRHAERKEEAPLRVRLLGRDIEVVDTDAGLRAIEKGKPDDPRSVERYLTSKLKDHLGPVRTAMEELAGRIPPREVNARAFRLYERFRPEVPAGAAGWGKAGVLDLEAIRAADG
jgi:hypothetical protein